MQYKIPVQIENEDPIILNLSIRQVLVIMAGLGLAYLIFNFLISLQLPGEIAFIPALIIAVSFFFMAVFKVSEMTFIPFMLAFIRYSVNISTRKWIKGTDSFSVLDIGYVKQNKKVDKKVDFGDKMNKMQEIDKKLEKI